MGPGAHAGRIAGGWLIAAATALVLLGGSILPFLTPAYLRFEQDRTGAGALTGYSPSQLDEVTGWLVGGLLWQGGFDRTLDGERVLKDPEIDHMLDVRAAFTGFYALVLASIVVLVVAFRRAGTEARVAAWRAVARGATGLALALALAGALILLAFDAAFEVFHRLFFSAGSYTFDPRTDRMVQLFPYDFWPETAAAVGVVAFLAAVAAWWFARGRSRAAARGGA